MFDEMNEGTACLKVVSSRDELPAQGEFLALDTEGDRLPSDWYLQLAGAAGKMLRREIPLTENIPLRP